jgi:hypothetical protein
MTLLSEGIPEPGEERRYLSVKPQFKGTALAVKQGGTAGVRTSRPWLNQAGDERFLYTRKIMKGVEPL